MCVCSYYMICVVAIILVCCAIQIISKLEREEGEPWPSGRSFHAACCLDFGSQHPHLLVTGGLNNDNKILEDAWLFDVNNGKWKEVSGIILFLYQHYSVQLRHVSQVMVRTHLPANYSGLYYDVQLHF